MVAINTLYPVAEATTAQAGLLPAADKAKLDDTYYVTDYGADPSGVADSATAINSCITAAVAADVHRIVFPKGDYKCDSTINLPIGTLKKRTRFIVDLAGSRVKGPTGAALFARTISDVDDTYEEEYIPTIRDGYLIAQTQDSGTGVEIHKALNVHLANLKFSGFETAIKLSFCISALIENINCAGVDSTGVNIKTATGDFTHTGQANPNLVRLHNVRVGTRSVSTSAVGFRVANGGNVALNHCVVEGDAMDKAFLLIGNEAGTPVVGRDVTLFNCWCEAKVSINEVIAIEGVQDSRILIDTMRFSNLPGTPLLMSLDADTYANEIVWQNCTGIQDNTSHVIFDANIQVAAANQNRWSFCNCALPSTHNFRTASLWTVGVNGTVPTHVSEDTWHPDDNSRTHADLTLGSQELLMQLAGSDAIVQGSKVSALQEGAYTSGNWLLGENNSGSLAKFEVPTIATGANRKDGIDSIGAVSGAVALDFDTGSFDNKSIELSADVTDLSLSATRDGAYQIHVKNTASARLQVSTSLTDFSPQTSEFIISPDTNEWSVLRLIYNSTDDVFHWG